MYKHDVGCDPSRLTSRGVNQNSVVPKPEVGIDIRIFFTNIIVLKIKVYF